MRPWLLFHSRGTGHNRKLDRFGIKPPNPSLQVQSATQVVRSDNNNLCCLCRGYRSLLSAAHWQRIISKVGEPLHNLLRPAYSGIDVTAGAIFGSFFSALLFWRKNIFKSLSQRDGALVLISKVLILFDENRNITSSMVSEFSFICPAISDFGVCKSSIFLGRSNSMRREAADKS